MTVIFFFSLEVWIQPRRNSVKLPAWDLQHLSSFCACHVILWSPLTRREGKKFDPSRNCVLSTVFKSMKRTGLFMLITHQITYYDSLNERSELNFIVLIIMFIGKNLFSCSWKETDPGKLIATCFICYFFVIFSHNTVFIFFKCFYTKLHHLLEFPLFLLQAIWPVRAAAHKSIFYFTWCLKEALKFLHSGKNVLKWVETACLVLFLRTECVFIWD